ncbi:MAG: LysM peptidoglycan-binding domain-containing protein [Candidatus Berkelbacteria bacterium]|nr:LysM peptidoglycan-binding domain-containing protein [Candidatus Berkelbacteria bacterium]
MKEKVLPILMPLLVGIFGFIIGISVTKINTSNTNPSAGGQNQQTENKTEATQPKDDSGIQTYQVQKGDTLFSISLKFNVSLEELQQLNNITDPNQIKYGQTIKIPKSSDSSTAGASQLQIDLAKMKEIQALVDQGNQPWRLDPIEVTKAEAPANYELAATDSYTLKSKDDVRGEATVEVKKNIGSEIKTYTVSLVQPVTKGGKGIWAIISIK